MLSDHVKKVIQSATPQQSNFKQRFAPSDLPLSELSQFISGRYSLEIPVYTVWGACEDVRVLEKFRSNEYKVPNLHIIDEANSRLLDVGGIKLRLLGLGGAVVMHKLFDNGEGRTTIAGGQGTMWTTLLQMGELVDTSVRVYDPTETRVFVTHASPAREGILNQLSVSLKADFSISAGLHFRYGSSYNEFSVNPTLDHYRGKLAASKASFNDVWETVKGEVEPAVDNNETQKTLLQNALNLVGKMPSVANGGNPFGGNQAGQGAAGQVDESAFKNMWNFNLADAAFGYLVLEIEGGRIGTEMRAQGFNFAHRMTGGKQVTQPAAAPQGMMNATNSVPMSSMGGPGQSRPTGPSAPQTGPLPAQGNQNFPMQQQTRPQSVSQNSTSQQNKATPGPVRSGASPIPSVPAQVKPVTPQPAGAANVNIPPPADKPTTTPAASAPAPESRNGTTSGDNKSASTNPTPIKTSSPATEKKPSTGLFIHNVESEQAVRDLFPREDQPNITRIDKHGKFNHVVHFANHETAKAALERQPHEHRLGQRGPPGPGSQPRKPHVKYYDERGPPRSGGYPPRDGGAASSGGQAGSWQPSNRGGANAGPRQGYQSGASDSEGARRGGFRGGRGGRGGDRGGRGGRGGGNNSNRGSFSAKAGGAEGEATSTPPKPAAASEATPAAASSS